LWQLPGTFQTGGKIMQMKSKNDISDRLYDLLDDGLFDMYDIISKEDFRTFVKKALEDYTLVCTASILEED